MTDQASVDFDPAGRQTAAPVDSTLLAAADAADVGIEHLCGGNGRCGTCAVDIEAGTEALSPPSDTEVSVLSADRCADGRRLACRCTIEAPGTIDVAVPPRSQTDGEVVLTEGVTLDVDHDPAVEQYRIELDRPSLEDTVADRERLLGALADGYDLDLAGIDHELQRRLPDVLRAGEGETVELTATVYDDETVIDVHEGTIRERYGLAIDVGTTTLAVYLIDLTTGTKAAVASAVNPQTGLGEDLMARMRHCRNADDGREELQALVVDGLNDLIDEVIDAAGISRRSVYEAVAVGNTAMHHLVLGYDPTHVAGSPYVPARQASVTLPAREVGLELNPAGRLHWLPVSGGWVGPDKVAVMLAAEHVDDDGVTVCIDIGTNGEISVATPEGVRTTSAPAGPALEGGELTCGVRAKSGAIDAVEVDPETFAPTVHTIDDAPPIGICGSGVIDAIAACFVAGVVDRRGTISDAAAATDHVVELDDGELAYVLAPADAAATDEPILLTQNDIRDAQMAKAAIQAATRVLLEEAGDPSVDRVVVAGGFGNHIDVRSAIDVGLYPDVVPSAVESLGNGAGAGAVWALLDREARERADAIVAEATYHEIAGTDAFEAQFLEAMYLPHQRFETCPRVKDRIESARPTVDVESVGG